MKTTSRLARFGIQVLDAVCLLIVLAVAGFGGYSLYARNQIREAGSSQEMMKYKPADGTKSLHELMEKNPDVIGWITMNGTRIDQPVVQGKDDSEYLNRDAEGRFSLAGSVFLTCENHPDFSDSYNLLYGHHMEEGGMFGDVIEYLDGSFFRKHQTGTLTTGDGRWQIHVFAVLKTGASDPYVYRTCETDELLAYLKKKARWYEEPDGQHLIALSTCYSRVTEGRVILFGTLNEKDRNDPRSGRFSVCTRHGIHPVAVVKVQAQLACRQVQGSTSVPAAVRGV